MNKIKGILFFMLAITLGLAITTALLIPSHYYDKLSTPFSATPAPTTTTATTTTAAVTTSEVEETPSTSIIKKQKPSIEVVDGTDWRLPSYTHSSKFGGLVSETYGSPDYVSTRFHIVRWDETNPQQGKYDFSKLEALLKRHPKQSAMLRLEVHSKCEAPNWALKQLKHTKHGSLVFWEPAYLQAITPYIKEVGAFVSNHPEIISVQLGIADGEYKGSCKLFNMKDGWGEFSMNPEELKEAKTQFGFTPQIFENSVKKIVDLYASAFGKNTYKLAFNNFDPYFSWTDIAEPYNALMPSIAQHVLSRGIGNRDGQVEHWMRYIHKIYGMKVTPANNQTCSLDMDERVAGSIAGRYWGTENEFYGDLDYVRAEHGSYSNQPYRFFISSMRSLQMRRTHSLIYARGMEKLDHPVYKTQDFLRYLNKTMGKQLADTPDLFLVLGERYVANYRMPEYPEHLKCQIDGGTAFRSFGRWLTESSNSQPAMRISMPVNDQRWGQGFYLPGNINHEYAARSSKEFSFNINEELGKLRCPNNCETTVKITYLDNKKTTTWVETLNGLSKKLETKGDGKVRTASFKINMELDHNPNQNDLWIKSSGNVLSLMLLRINLPRP